ncbi:hypothetical protein JTE90_027952 [Oedothorax gibbosus]|uniref:Uncharacterized protein n=1 Tax=Oedothorax gibbosus TaxID=931172 RepID=A0AAV6VF33_9ARAC|nr:hypothetical protein JTE90_027952 [Oedothorax gibbosus]
MPKPIEIFWEVGKQLWKNKWERGEFVKSQKFPVTDTCSLEIYFYPEGLEDYEKPLFKRVRSSTNEWMNIKGDIQLCHGITIAKWYLLDDVFEKGQDFAMYYYLEDIPNLSKFRIFHSLPELCYRLIFTVSTDEAAYAKRSTKLKPQSSDPNANSFIKLSVYITNLQKQLRR